MAVQRGDGVTAGELPVASQVAKGRTRTTGKKMKKLVLVAALGMALVIPASARQVCNHDPVCQAKRDGTSVESKVRAEAQRRAQRAPRPMRGDCRMRGTC